MVRAAAQQVAGCKSCGNPTHKGLSCEENARRQVATTHQAFKKAAQRVSFAEVEGALDVTTVDELPELAISKQGSGRLDKKVTVVWPKYSERLRSLREAHQISLRQVTEHLGCSRSYLAQIETGRLKPNLNIFRAYAACCRVGLEEILRPEEISDLNQRAKKHSCKNCGQSGHNARSCKKVREKVVPGTGIVEEDQRPKPADQPSTRTEVKVKKSNPFEGIKSWEDLPWCNDCGQVKSHWAGRDRVPRCDRCFAAYLQGVKLKVARIERS
jgi:transcriptional regulator with XRE-family HTH domain